MVIILKSFVINWKIKSYIN